MYNTLIRKKIVLIGCIFAGSLCSTYAQVGINTKNPKGIFHIDSSSNTSLNQTSGYEDDVLVDNAGNIGIGTLSPTNKIHINTNGKDVTPFKLNDGTQGEGKYLVTDANGLASWATLVNREAIRYNIGTGINVYMKTNPAYVTTGSTIVLPPGRWVLLVNIFLQTYNVPSTVKSGDTFAVSLTFADPTTVGNSGQTLDKVATPYLESSKKITYASSAANPVGGGTGFNGPIVGSIIIRNTTTSNMTYTLMIGDIKASSTDLAQA